MNCMKCGREIPLGQAFCKDCLTDMEHYPVKPGTPIQLPQQAPVAVNRKPAHPHKVKKPEEQLARLRRLVKLQTLALFVLVLVLLVSGFYSLKKLSSREQPLIPGQNYSTAEPTVPAHPQVRIK